MADAKEQYTLNKAQRDTVIQAFHTYEASIARQLASKQPAAFKTLWQEEREKIAQILKHLGGNS